MPIRHDCQVILVSDQNATSLTPALDRALSPSRVVLVVAPRFRQMARWLRPVLRSAGLQVDEWPVDDAFDTEALQRSMIDLAASLADCDAALNVGGGTAPMVVAALEAFDAARLPIFVVHPDSDRLVWLRHEGAAQAHNVADRVRLPAFLAAHGAPVESQGSKDGISADRRALCRQLIDQGEALARPLARLNWLASGAERSLRSEPVRRQFEDFDALVGAFSAVGAVRWDGSCLEFPTEADRFFVNGGWLEEHVFALLYALRSSHSCIQDLSRSVQIGREVGDDPHPVRNELDVAFLANNHLHIVECKTKRFAREQHEAARDDHGTDVLYKLDSLVDVLGGLQARAMLVSMQRMSDWDQRRAESLGIRVVAGNAVRHLESTLVEWIPERQRG